MDEARVEQRKAEEEAREKAENEKLKQTQDAVKSLRSQAEEEAKKYKEEQEKEKSAGEALADAVKAAATALNPVRTAKQLASDAKKSGSERKKEVDLAASEWIDSAKIKESGTKAYELNRKADELEAQAAGATAAAAVAKANAATRREPQEAKKDKNYDELVKKGRNEAGKFDLVVIAEKHEQWSNDYLDKNLGAKGTEVRDAFEKMKGGDEGEYAAVRLGYNKYDTALYMSEEERDTYFYYYGLSGKKAAKEYLERVRAVKNEAKADFEYKRDVKEASEHKVYGAIKHTGSNLLDITGLPYTAAQAIKGETVDPNSPWFKFARTSQATAEGIKDDMGQVGQFLTDVGLNIADNIARGAVYGPFAAEAMFMQAGSSAAYEGTQKTNSSARIFANAVLNGLEEGWGESIRVGNLEENARKLLSKGGFRNHVLALLSQMGVEATEEAATQVMNIATDLLVMGDDADLAQYYQGLKQSGVSNPKAMIMAAAEATKEVVYAGAMGAISGGVMQGIQSIGGSVINKGKEAYQAEKSNPNIIDVEYEVRDAPEAPLNNDEAETREKSASDMTFEGEHGELQGTDLPTLAVGDTFRNVKTGEILTVVEKNADTTVIAENGGKLKKKYPNAQADMIIADERYEKVEQEAAEDTPTAPTAPTTPTAPKSITLTQMGDFYEIFGDEATEVADKLNLTLTHRSVNGEKIAMVGFPVHMIDKYRRALGSDYSLVLPEQATQNQAAAEVIDHAKEIEGLKLIDAERSTLSDGRTLVTGVYEVNSDKDLNRRTHKMERFNIFVPQAPYVRSVEGTTYGHYAVAKSQAGGYTVTYLPAGVAVARALHENDAMALAQALDARLPQLPLRIEAYGDGYRCYGTTEGVKRSVENVVASVVGNKEITLPLKNKKELISYLRNHVGDKIGVTYGGGDEEIRTIVSASNVAIVTEQADGQRVSLRAKADELSYTENGFVYTGGSGTVTYRFIWEDAETAVDNSEAVTSENGSAIPYSDKEKQNWENSKDIIVYESDEQFEAFIEKVLKNEDVHKKIYFGKIPNETAQMVLDKTGIDVSGHNIALKGYEIRKILLNSHGDEKVEAARGQEPIMMDDLKNIPSVITNPDDVSLSEKEYEGKPALFFEKTIDGKNYVVAYVSRKHHDVAIQTMYKKRSLATAENANALSLTSETTSSTASDNIVSQSGGIVNSGVGGTDEKNSADENKPKIEKALKTEAESGTIEKNPTNVIADYVIGKLANGEKITAFELLKVSSEAFGGSMADNAYTIKDVYDAMELGVNKYILSMKDVSAEKMLGLLELLPTQTKRTEEMVRYQQFSTPPSIAFLANYAANISPKDIMLEPSAGIGGIAVFAKHDGATVYANELDDRRLGILKNMPFDGFFNEDAEQLDNIFGGKIEPTVIVMNPPFSSSSGRNMQGTKIGAKHIEQALKILAPNGRLVAIVGRGMDDGAPAFKNWWKDIKSHYNVRANIRINGKNYSKYGTNFDIQMIVIDKDGATTHTETGVADTIQELKEKLEAIRNERPVFDYSENEQRAFATARAEAVEGGKSRVLGDTAVSDNSGVKDNRIDRGNVGDAQRAGGELELPNVRQADEPNGSAGVEAPQGTNEVSDKPRNNGDGGVHGVSRRGNNGLQDSGRADGNTDMERSEQSGVAGDNGDAQSGQNNVGGRRLKKKELTDNIFERYQPQPLKIKNAKPHPASVSESAAMNAIEPPPITYTPNIAQSIVESGALSDVQLEAISYAGQSHQQILPDGTARGFLLGDGTGIGKGRTIAGIILDNYNQGRKKSLWVTLNASLVNDAKRDVKAVFGNSDLVVQFVGGKKAARILSKDEAIMVISYDTLSKGHENKDSNFEKLVNWFGKDFDGVIVFDESHKMGNATETKGARGKKAPSKAALAGIALQKALPKAKIVYSSATAATEVENLRYAERLGLWGEGTAFATGDDFVSKIKAGGLAAMELIARDMKATGVYLSRNISYEDVRYDRIVHKLSREQKEIYDELARSWQIVLQNLDKALKNTNQGKNGEARGRALGAFWSSQQRFFNQILTAMQVPSVISDIEKQLADGKSCVIQLVSTNEAAQNEEMERIKSGGLDIDEFDLTPKQMLMSYIENSFPVQQYEEYKDDDGNVKSKAVFDSKGNPVLNRDALQQREELLLKLGSIKVPSSPLDMIINHFGTDMVAENTGRTRRIVQKDGKFVEEKIGSKKDADVDAFQNGKKRIIIFSKAGGTGKSYHADRAAKNQQQRVHYLLEAGWQADNAVQGFGRSHRSNQAVAPIFKLVTTDLKGQMRFISTIAKRLDQLGAMTKGQRQAGGQGMFSASDNLENALAQDVLAAFYKDLIFNHVEGIDNGLDIIAKLGLEGKLLDKNKRVKPTAPELREVNKFLNRILSLESSEQNAVFEAYQQRLQDATEKAAAAGTLDRGLENYKADRITLNEVKDIREDERSGAKTKYCNLTAEHKIKPVKFENIPTDIKNFVGWYRNKTTGKVRAVFKTSSTTDQYGNVTDNFKLVGQIKSDYIEQNRFYGKWTKIEADEAEKLWNEEIARLPEYRKENLHLISGVVLPVWGKLPTENVRIYRVLTSDGEMLIGRVVSEDKIDETLRRLGSSRKKEKIATKDLISGIKNGDTVYLENDWKIVQRKVSGENRIEVVGPTRESYDLLVKKGLFTERIQYSTRYFVPTDTNTEKIIDELLKVSQVLRVENAKYSITESEVNNLFNAPHDVMEKFAAQVDGWLNRTLPSNEVLRLGSTPEVLKQLGAKDLPVVMNQDVLSKITGGKHDISLDEIKNLPQAIADPIMVFNSATVPNAFVILTELIDKSGNSVVSAMHINKYHNTINVNRIASVYGKDNIDKFVKNQIQAGNLKYYNKNKSQNWSTSRGLQLPKLVQSNPDNNIILEKEDIVNKNKSQDMRTRRGLQLPKPSTNLNSNNIILEKEDIVNKNKSQDMRTRRGLQLPKPSTNLNSNNIILEKEDIVNTYDVKNSEKNSLEAKENGGNNLLSGDGGRAVNESAGKQTGRVSSYKRKIAGREATQRKSTAKEITLKGHTEEVVDGNHKYTLVKEEDYNDDMKTIAAEARAYGKEVGFFIGNAVKKFDGRRDFRIDGIRFADGKILVRYDGENSPQALLMHELVHDEWDSPEMQRAKEIILSDLSESDKKEILQKGRYRAYMELYDGNEAAVWEEFVADAFALMNNYSEDYVDTAADYWYNDDIADRYSPAEYIKDMDAGGNKSVLDNIGFGNEYSLSRSKYMMVLLPKQEYALVCKAVMAKNAGKTDSELKPIDYVYAADEFYVYENYSIGEFSVIRKFDVETEFEKINDVMECVNNGTYADRERFDRLIDDVGRGEGSHSRNNDRLENGRYAMANDRISGKKQRSNSVGYSFGDGEDNGAKYSLNVYDSDAESLTPERKKEIFAQWERDHAERQKPNLRQRLGERAARVSHNITRVFPDIPERGEGGTFFAEFRKDMIQWKSLPATTSFIVQDKLNKMTEGLTPAEFRTFSELVYFLDLQEEAQIQKERGYDEILLPNEITAQEVDEIVKVLNEEATDNVNKALEKRRSIWEELKTQYVELNRYIGFDTEGRFKRKNYYHHQVIDYMNKNGSGAGGGEIGIKVGRGWLKERRGSTEAINTDFLYVEYEAMLQMQYDVYVAEMLGKIKQQYDIKPKLEDEAFRHNKRALDEIIKKECTDEDGNVMLDGKGEPNSETYRRQKWYNTRIMLGFSGLFDLARRGELPDFDAEYADVVEALKRRDLNVDGLYKYVGIIANMQLSDESTESQEQAVRNARSVLKYTSQKKAWIKETLADDYQTWESIAKTMRETHVIHQPRRGNYFYSKTVVDEEAFSSAFNEMIMSLASGEIDSGNADVNELFVRYADTVRLMGAAYEQWVLPKEIVTTMNEIANPKQVGLGLVATRAVVSTWKGWATSINPLRTVKFGLRNLFGDLDAVIAGDPKILIYSKQAVYEISQAMIHKRYSDSFMEWVKRGGYTSMIFANEMDTEMQNKLFARLKGKQGTNILQLPTKALAKYCDGVENAHNFREAILRYSAYLYYKNEIARNGGRVIDYVASNRYIVDGLRSTEDKAYQLSKDLLGAYDEVGVMGQILRRYWFPFYSFTETNMKRYFRLFENIVMSNDAIPKKAAKLLIKALMANLLVLLMVAWNRLVMKEADDKLPPSARYVPHITYGEKDGRVFTFRQLGSFSELLEWVGLEDYKWTKEDLTAPIDKAWGMLTPFVKLPVELATGLNFYPSLTEPRAIRDKWQHFFNSWGVDEVYNIMTGKPSRGKHEILGEVKNLLKDAFIYEYDYKESAYYEILDIKREWQGENSGFIDRPKGAEKQKRDALYYMKKAIRYKDEKTALKYLDEYFEYGGTAKGIRTSIARLDPMYGFNGKDTAEKGEEFIASLTPQEKEKLEIANEYYAVDLALPETVYDKLGKKDITNEEAKNVLRVYISAKTK